MSENEERLMKVREVAQRLTISVRKIWRDVAAGLFPAPIKLGPRTTRWRESEIEQFLRGEWISTRRAY